jgi:hypothetical protein
MTQRTVKDESGRIWTCKAAGGPTKTGEAARPMGLDVRLSCSTETVAAPVSVTVGWGWEKIAENGLARMIVLAEPVSTQ